MAGAVPVMRKRRGLTVSLRTLMVLIVVLAGCLAHVTHQARAQRRAVEVLEAAGAVVRYDDRVEYYGPGVYYGPVRARPAWQRWLMKHVGADYVQTARMVSFHDWEKRRRALRPPRTLTAPLGDDAWQAIEMLPGLTMLDVRDLSVRDADLAHLRRLTRLRFLNRRQRLQRRPRGRGRL